MGQQAGRHVGRPADRKRQGQQARGSRPGAAGQGQQARDRFCTVQPLTLKPPPPAQQQQPLDHPSQLHTWGTSAGEMGCPGMGMHICTPAALTPGKTRVRASAAACALGLPPARQSSKLNRDWRTCGSRWRPAAGAGQHAGVCQTTDNELIECHPPLQHPEAKQSGRAKQGMAMRASRLVGTIREATRHPPSTHPPGCCRPLGSCPQTLFSAPPSPTGCAPRSSPACRRPAAGSASLQHSKGRREVRHEGAALFANCKRLLAGLAAIAAQPPQSPNPIPRHKTMQPPTCNAAHVKGRRRPPPHQPEVELHGRLCQHGGVHGWRQVSSPRPRLASLVGLPATQGRGSKAGGQLWQAHFQAEAGGRVHAAAPLPQAQHLEPRALPPAVGEGEEMCWWRCVQEAAGSACRNGS